MTPIGHTFTGLTIGWALLPWAMPRQRKAATLVAVAVLANAPDLPLPAWGHDRYDISHSLFVTIALALLLGWGLRRLVQRPHRPPLIVLLAGALAWLSHLLLDTFYNHGHGLAMFWPLSPERVALPIPWLTTAHPQAPFSLHNLRVAFLEVVTFGLLLALVVAGKPLVGRHLSTART